MNAKIWKTQLKRNRMGVYMFIILETELEQMLS